MQFPIPDNEAQRLITLRDLQVLDSLPQKMFDDITELAAGICGTPMALISLVDEDRQWFKSRQGLALSETARNESFCAHTIMTTDGVLVIKNASQDSRFADFPLVSSGEVRFYAGAPITTPDGYALGAVCVLDPKERELSQEHRRQLQHLADLTMRLIENEVHRRQESRAILDQVRKNEQIIRSVLDEGREMCSFIDSQHRYLYVNPAYGAHWMQPCESLIGMHVQDVIGPQLYAEVIKPGINQALAGHEALLTFTHDYPGVGPRRMEARYIPARDEHGQVFGVVERFRDVTELAEQADILRQHVAELRARRAVQDKYLHAISHDLKEPVNAINNAAPMLIERLGGTLPALENRCLGFIAQAGQHMDQLLEDMRVFGELESGLLHKTHHPARELVQRSLVRLKDQIARRQTQVELHVKGELTANAPALELGVRCAVLDLLRSSTPVSSTLEVRLLFDGNMARLEITDRSAPAPLPPILITQGASFDATKQGACEEPFAPSMARHIAHLHGGWLQEEITPEGWRRKTFLLPQGELR